MRDYLVLAIVFVSVPIALVNPYYGILVWSWLAYFNPHRNTWGMAREFPVAIVIAIPTLIGAFFARKNHRIMTRETLLLALQWAWFAFTSYYISTIPQFSGHVQDAKDHLQMISKILLMTFVMIVLVNSKEKLRGLVLIIVASFGFRALFATIFFLKTGGQYKIWGPDGTFLGDNNDFALALNMTIPMFFFMARSEQAAWMRAGIRILMVCVIISVIGTYSRGGLVGLTATVIMLVLNSRHKIVGLLLVSIGLWGVMMFTTAGWKGRMESFTQGDLDESAESRLVVWRGGWRLVQDYPITGGGFDVYTDEAAFSQYIDNADKWLGQHGPHSIYFQTLGEQGFVGLGLFLGLISSCFLSLHMIGRRSALNTELAWAAPYTRMFEISLVAYLANGATLGRAYFDLFYQIIACVIVLKIVWLREASVLVQQQFGISADMEAIPV